jgi:hypothetical protein
VTGAELAAVITAAAGLLLAVAAVIRAWRTSSQLQAHLQRQAVSVSRSARSDEAGWIIDE